LEAVEKRKVMAAMPKVERIGRETQKVAESISLTGI
jgi:hypothetical protein